MMSKLGEGDTLSERMENWAAGTVKDAERHGEAGNESSRHHCLGAAKHTREWIDDVQILESHILGLQEENEAMIAANPEWESLADEAVEERPEPLPAKMKARADEAEARNSDNRGEAHAQARGFVAGTRHWIDEVQNLYGYAGELLSENKRLAAEADSGRMASERADELRNEVERLEKANSQKFDEVLAAHRKEKELDSNVRLLKRIISEFIEQAFRRD